nr:aminoacyl-tRNA synthetase, class 1a, anticodon-binding [Tanacetum cinerariifolium]
MLMVPTGSGTLPAGSYSLILLDWFLLVVFLVPTVELVPTGSYVVPTAYVWSHIRYAPTHRPRIVFDSLVKQFWAIATVHTHEAGPSQIISNINGSKRHKFLMYLRFLQMILGIQTTDPSPRPTFDFTAKLFSNMKLSWDGPYMPLLASMLVVPTGRDGADAVADGAAAAHDVLPPIVSPIHSSSSIPGPSSAPQPTLMREPLPMREPTLIPPSPPPRSEEVGPTTSTRPPSPTGQSSFHATGQSSFHEDISEGGGDFVSLPKSNEALPTPAATAAGGAEDSAALTALSIKLDSSMDAVVHAAAAPSSPIPSVDKGKAPMVDDSLRADLLSEQERQEELAQKAQAERVASPTKHGPGLSDERRRELDAAQLIYTEADWVELLAKIATNSALSKQLLGDDVTKDNMNERLGMLLLCKRRELAEQSRVKPMTKTQQRDYIRDFVKNNSALVYNQGWTMKKPTLDAPSAKRANQGVPQVPAASSHVPASVPAAPSFATDVSISAATTPEVPAAESRPADTPTAFAYVSVESSVAASTPSSSRKRRKHIAKKRVTPTVDIADDALIKFDSDSGSDDDPLSYAPYAGWEMKQLGIVDNLYQREDPDTFALLLRGDLHVLFQSLDDEDAHDFWHNQDSWRIHSWHLYPRAQVHILETMDGRVIFMFVDVSYPLSASTLERMLKHGLEVPKLLVGADLTMAEQLSWLAQEQTALGKDKSNMLIVGSLLKTIWSSMHHLLTNEVLTSPEQTAPDQMLLFHNPAVFGVPVGLSCWSPYSCWFLVAAVWLVAAGFVLFMLLE